MILTELPARLRMYESFEYVKKLIQSYIKVNMLIVELKSDALKERHWKLLTQKVKYLKISTHCVPLSISFMNSNFFFLAFCSVPFTKQLRVNWILSDLTLGQVWDVNLLKVFY